MMNRVRYMGPYVAWKSVFKCLKILRDGKTDFKDARDVSIIWSDYTVATT